MGFLNILFGGAPTKYDAQKYFDYAEKQKAKGNIVEALSYYAKVINHGDLGVKPFVPTSSCVWRMMNGKRYSLVSKSIERGFRKKTQGGLTRHHLSLVCHQMTNRRYNPNTWEW